MVSMKVLQLSTVHIRNDTRIFLKESSTLRLNFGDQVALAVADGLGDAEGSDSIPAIYDLGKPSGGRIGRVLFGSVRAFRLIRTLRPRVVHFHEPELIPLGLVLKPMGIKIVYDVHEDVPRQIQAKHWIPRPLRNGAGLAMTGFEGLAATYFDALVAATPKIAERFPEHKTVTIQNFPLPSEYARGRPGIAFLISFLNQSTRRRSERLVVSCSFSIMLVIHTGSDLVTSILICGLFGLLLIVSLTYHGSILENSRWRF